ncbi:MAG TPA: DUF1697 domain-containing protein [Gemmatimonadales bacterium]
MPRYFAFLRAINVGGHTVKNTELVKLFAGAGIPGAETFIASGNVTFTSTAKSVGLEKKLEAHFEKKLGYEVKTFLRTHAELVTIGETRPFPKARHASATVLVVGFLAEAPTAAQKKILAGFNNDESDFAAIGRELYWLCQVNQSASAFFKVPFEKRFGAASTWRNMNTVERLLAKYPD